MQKGKYNIIEKKPVPQKKWVAGLLCVWIVIAMLIGYILFDGPIFSSLDAIDAYAAGQAKLAWLMGENPKPTLPTQKGEDE